MLTASVMAFATTLGHNNADGARSLQCLGVLDQRNSGLRGAALHLEAAKGNAGLGCQADMPDHTDAGLDHAFNGGRHILSSLQLNGVAIGLHEDAICTLDRLRHADVVGAKGHVANDKGLGRTQHNRCRVMNDIVNSHANRAVSSEDNHCHRIAHQNDLGLAVVDNRGHRIVIRGHKGKFTSLGLELLKIGNRHFFLVGVHLIILRTLYLSAMLFWMSAAKQKRNGFASSIMTQSNTATLLNDRAMATVLLYIITSVTGKVKYFSRVKS